MVKKMAATINGKISTLLKVKLPDITEVPDVTQKSLVREH